jgi:hypothetical protein
MSRLSNLLLRFGAHVLFIVRVENGSTTSGAEAFENEAGMGYRCEYRVSA